MSKVNKKVIVAMSGGIDSSVAAVLLKKEGFDVIGVFMKFWAEKEKGKENRCCTSESEKRARLVAKKLNIPFYVFNFEKEFKKKVVDYFLREEKAGLTPNPCVICNKEIKFNLLFKKLKSLKADYIATGHYANTNFSQKILKSRRNFSYDRRKNFKVRLLKGKDKEKDQSYFLWKLNQNLLKHILFPIGDYTKPEIKKLAKKFKLPVLDIPESQEICFIKNTTESFLKKHLKKNPGEIRDKEGNVLGFHQGLWFYTIGQRKGIELPLGPFYVLKKDLKKNLLIVTKRKRDLFKRELIVRDVNWVSGKEPKLPLKTKVQIRYKHQPASAVLSALDNKVKVAFSRYQRAITPGQSAVFYKGEEVLGGGIIEMVLK